MARPGVWRAQARRLAGLLFLVVVAAGGLWLGQTYRVDIDMSTHGSHTLSPASIALLETVEGPITATAYFDKRAAIRDRIQNLLAPYQRHKADFELAFVDPKDVPERVRDEEIRHGELVFRIGDRSERVSAYSEREISNAIARLVRKHQRWMVFISGHGERSPIREANHDVSDWAATLEKRGIKVRALNLAEFPSIPGNTSLLVIAGPQTDYLDGEVASIVEFVAAGGTLLWLTEPAGSPSLKPLGEYLGIRRVPGTVIDPVTQALGIDNPAVTVVSRYAEHPATHGFNLAALFPFAAALHIKTSNEWEATGIFYSGDKAWSETDTLEGNVAYDEGTDFKGPFAIGVALQRKQAGSEQRVVVIGDGDFVSNTFLYNSGNQDLAVRLVEWLVKDDSLVAVPSRIARDSTLSLQKWHAIVIGFGFLFILPGALLANGIVIWWRRRRA